MRYIITESHYKKLIKEAKEHTDDEIVEFNEIDLQHEYNKLNDLLFGGKLYPIEMLWNKRRSVHGSVTASINRRTKEITIKALKISQFLAITYKYFKDILAHEMIHVYWLQHNINAKHDYRFVQQMNRINGMGLGFNVSIKGDSSKFELSKETLAKKKQLVVLVTKVEGESTSRLSVMGLNLYKTKGYRISDIYETLTYSGKEQSKYGEVLCDFYLSDNPELQRYPVQKSLYNLRFHNMPDEKAANLVDGAKWLAGFVARSGDSKWDGTDFPSR